VFYILRWCRITLERPIGSCETRIGDSLRSLLKIPIRIA
jgi:hypothetical protein